MEGKIIKEGNMVKTLLFIAGTILTAFFGVITMKCGDYLISAVCHVLALSMFVWSRGKFLSRWHTHLNYAFFNGILVWHLLFSTFTYLDVACLFLLGTAWYCHWKIPSKITEAR